MKSKSKSKGKVKHKTHKGAKKRVLVTAGGKLKIRRAGAGHLLSHKSANRRRHLRQAKILEGAAGKNILRAIGEL